MEVLPRELIGFDRLGWNVDEFTRPCDVRVLAASGRPAGAYSLTPRECREGEGEGEMSFPFLCLFVLQE